ncbi:F-box domain-containing protein [Heracleum sosnowskyi]|uniref:F-box domain-containing protein n=1 Tax=Heracleum sosnowskyi TaxID=360622 RepID=A0AAD8HFE3_9APIA|nr:F-box domain-containing protein [Heracleum sosnowskyi]
MELPCELLMNEILFRLPIKHLLRCRCVSKGWCSLIDSNAFVKKRLQRMIECDARGVIFIGLRGELYIADFDSLDDDSASVVELNNPLNTCISDKNVVGNSANGLVYMVNDEMEEFVIFNPSTRKARKIPSPPSRFLDSYYLVCCGFGYDYVNDDYKILKIALDYPFFIIGIVLYSIKTNKWTWIDDVPRNITGMFTTDAISASGYLYFMAQNNLNSTIILGFNFGLQQFEEFPYPNGTAVGSCSRWIDSFEGSLSLVESYSNSDSHSCMDVWVLNHSWEDNNWFKAFSLELPTGFGCFGPVALSRSKKDILFVLNKEKLIEKKTLLKWYDIERKTFQNVKIRGIPTVVKPYVYTKSLLQLTGDDLLQKPLHDKQNSDNFLSKDSS